MRVLVIVDCQNDLVIGAHGPFMAQSIIPHMKERAKQYADGETLILFTKDARCQSSGWSLVKEISNLADGYSNFLIYSDEEIIRSRIVKDTFGSIKMAEVLKRYEKQISNITFMGFNTDTSIISNVLLVKSFLPEVPITVDASCCAGTTLDKHLAALEVMKSCQIDVIH